jgi:hypothetical protein
MQTLYSTIETICEILGDNGKVPSDPLIEIFSFLSERDASLGGQGIHWVMKMNDLGDSLSIKEVLESLRELIVPDKHVPVSPVETKAAVARGSADLLAVKEEPELVMEEEAHDVEEEVAIQETELDLVTIIEERVDPGPDASEAAEQNILEPEEVKVEEEEILVPAEAEVTVNEEEAVAE